MKTIKLDTTGKLCPFPLLEAKKEIAALHSDDVMIIEYDCAQATENLPRWTVEEGHSVVDFEQSGTARWQISIQKG